MKTPVIIAAHNEESMIGRALSRLDDRYVEPHVIANGCDDKTADISREFGAEVYEVTEAGKLPAIQSVLKALGERALGPVLYLDADSYPLNTKTWERHMLGSLDTARPSSASGPIMLDTLGATGLVYSAKYYIDTLQAYRNGSTRFRGANMATSFRDEGVLKRVLELPHIWLGEDVAIEIEIKEEGGSSKQVIHPGALVTTSSRYVLPVSKFLTTSRTDVRKKSIQQYKDRAAEGSIPLGRYLKNRERTK